MRWWKEPGDLIHSDICRWIDRIEIFPHIHGWCNSDDVPLCTKDKDGKGSKGMLPHIQKYFRKMVNASSRSEPMEAASTGSKWLNCVGRQGFTTKKQRYTHQNKTALQNGQTGWFTKDPCGHGSLERTMGGNFMCHRPSHELKPTLVITGMTPYKALYGERPEISYLVAIGTKAFVHITKTRMRKLDPRNFEGIMVRYGGSYQYRIWSPVERKCCAMVGVTECINWFLC